MRSMEARIVANSDGNADRVLQVVGTMAEEVRRAFGGLDESMCRLTVEAALGNAQSSEGLDRLAAALLEQQRVVAAHGTAQLDAVQDIVASLGPELAGHFAQFAPAQAAATDPDTKVKIDALVAMVGSMQQQVSEIASSVGDLKTATAELSARSDNMPFTFFVIPKPETQKLGAGESVFAKTVNFVKRKLTDKVVRLAWEQSKLVFVCPVTMQEVPCGPDGKGYDISIPTAALKTAMPALKWGMLLLKVGLATQGMGAAVPDLSSLLPDMSMAEDFVGAYGGAIADNAQSALHSVSAADDSAAAAAALFYGLVKKAEGAEASTDPNWRPRLTGLSVVVSGRDQAVAWVSRAGQAQFHRQGREALR